MGLQDRIDTMDVLDERLIHSNRHGTTIRTRGCVGSDLLEKAAEMLSSGIGRRQIGHSTEWAAMRDRLQAGDSTALESLPGGRLGNLLGLEL